MPSRTLATSFAARIRALEEHALSPLAVRSYETRGRLRRRGRVRRAHAVPARPRPDRPLEAVPAAEGQDAGLHRPGRRPLPHAHDPHARDDRDRPRRRPRAAPERGSRRGDRPRPRHRPHAVRPRRRGGARRGAARAVRRPLPPQRAVAADRRAAQPDPRGARRHPHAHRRRRSPRRSRARSSASSTASPTSTTTSTTRSATASSSEGDLPRDEIDVLGATGSQRIDTLVHDLIETSEREGDIVQSDEVGARDALAARVHVRARLPRPGDARRARARPRDRPPDLRRARRPRRRRRTRSPSSSPA